MKRIISLIVLTLLLSSFSYASDRDIDLTFSKEASKKDAELKISFVGDIMNHGYQLRASFDGEKYDFLPVFEYVKTIFDERDLVFGNLETTLTADYSEVSGYPLFASPETFALDLKKVGFDFLFASNNHILDKGEKGLLNTEKFLMQYNIPFTGIQRDNPRIIVRNGIRIGVDSYTYATNGFNPKNVLVNYLDREEMLKDLVKMEESGAELKIIYLHFGNEYERTPNEEQKDLAHFLLENGADIVIGSHPHVLQTDEETKNGYIMYSLGNFVSNQPFDHTYYGAILNLKVKREDGKITVEKEGIIPTFVDRMHGDAYSYKIIPIDGSVDYESLDRIEPADLDLIEISKKGFAEIYGE